MTEMGRAVRNLGRSDILGDALFTQVVQIFHKCLLDEEARPASALVRIFCTRPFSDLNARQKEFALNLLANTEYTASTKCLTLLATAGEKPEWNSVTSSKGHLAIPLANLSVVEKAPMIASLIQQLGLEIRAVLTPPDDLIVEMDQKTYNVFHVPHALGSPFIPDQEFVKNHGIKSALGFGGMMPTGDLFAVLIFSKVSISKETAELFRPMALNVKLALLPSFQTQMVDA